jgi:hypothetical protein
VPVLVYEKIKTKQFLTIKRHKAKLVFVGKLPVLDILLIGLTGYWYLMGTKYQPPILNGLLAIMTTAKLDDRLYKITDWSQKKGRLMVYVEKETPKVKTETANQF